MEARLRLGGACGLEGLLQIPPMGASVEGGRIGQFRYIAPWIVQ
jgi:hypothetical protein